MENMPGVQSGSYFLSDISGYLSDGISGGSDNPALVSVIRGGDFVVSLNYYRSLTHRS